MSAVVTRYPSGRCIKGGGHVGHVLHHIGDDVTILVAGSFCREVTIPAVDCQYTTRQEVETAAAEWREQNPLPGLPLDPPAYERPVSRETVAVSVPRETVAVSVPRGTAPKPAKSPVATGDDLAMALAGHGLDVIYSVAAVVLSTDEFELRQRYAHLNPGQQRMNLGNRIRSMWKKSPDPIIFIKSLTTIITRATMNQGEQP